MNVADRESFDSPDQIPNSNKFAVSDYVNGRIVAVDDDMSKWNPADWMLLHNSLATDGISIARRVGVESEERYNNSNSFQIPGVGEPPIRTFQVLLTLFLVVAGPVMLLILKRTRQMQYLFVLVPALSLAVCSSLFIYAMIVDGSNRWGRTNSVTFLDHRTNMGVTHTRSSYYSGVHPGSYELPVDALGIPVSTRENLAVERGYVNGKMQLSGGDINARTPHRVLTARPIESKARLVISELDGASPNVQNFLGAEVAFVAVKTKKGVFIVRDLPEGKTKPAVVAGSAEVAASKLTMELSPQVVGYLARNRYYGSPDVSFGSACGEEYRTIETIRMADLLSLLKTNTYVAILKEFPLALEQTEEVQNRMQMHVVRGQW